MEGASRWTGLRADLAPRVAAGVVVATLMGLLIVPLMFDARKDVMWRRLSVNIEAGLAVSDVTLALAREMSSLRGYVLTGDPDFIERYRDTLEFERGAISRLERLMDQPPEPIRDAHGTLARRLEGWHDRPTEEEMLAATLDPGDYIERIEDEQAAWELVLASTAEVRDAIAKEETAIVREIVRLQTVQTFSMALLAFLGLMSAVATVLLIRLIQRLRDEADAGRQRIQALMQSKSRLIQGVTHDLRNPLAAVEGWARMLSAEEETLSEDEREAAVRRIRRLIGGTLGLVDDLMEVSLAEAGILSVDRKWVDVGSELRALYHEHEAELEAAGLSGHPEIDPAIPLQWTDPRRLRQMVGNLLSNAIKYTPAGGRVWLGARAAEGHLLVWVRDDGPGIPEAMHERIFEEFSRLDPGVARGAGLGLAMSRNIARLLGGEIQVDSAPGAGALFTLRLPLETAERENPTSPAKTRTPKQ